MSKGQFKGHYYSRLDHAQYMSIVPTLPCSESAVLLKLLVLTGCSRQQFDLCDGRMSISGPPLKTEDLAQWLAQSTPDLSRKRALDALMALEKSYGIISTSRAGVVKLKNWAEIQTDAPSASAARKQKSRLNIQVREVRRSLNKMLDATMEIDEILSHIQSVSKVRRNTASNILKVLVDGGDVISKSGQFFVCGSSTLDKYTAPSALSPLSEGEGESECDRSHSCECDMSQSLDHIRSEERYSVSHDYDARAGTRAYEVNNPPRDSLRSSPGPRIDEFRGESAEGAELRWDSGGSRGIDIWRVPTDQLPTAACKIFQPIDFSKTRDILSSRFQLLCRKRGAQKANEIFRQTVQSVQSEIMSGGNLRQPEREVCARLNEAAGLPRRKKKAGPL